MPLSFVEAGRRVRIAAIHAADGLQGRLASMGMAPGAEVEVLCNSVRGPFIVMVKGSRIVLGHGMAHKILVA